MKIKFSSKFKKNYKKRIKQNMSLQTQYRERAEIFALNSKDSLLFDHKLSGKLKGNRAFSITGDYRVVYTKISNDEVVFLDVGTHNQVYS